MRQFLAPVGLDNSGRIVLSDSRDYKYLCRVLRLAVSDVISVRLPDGQLCCMTVSEIDNGARRIVLTTSDMQTDSVAETGIQARLIQKLPVRYWLFQFLPKPQKMDFIIRQATEAGVVSIVPVIGKYSQLKCTDAGNRFARWEKIIKEARQQSGSSVPTAVQKPLFLRDAIALWEQEKDERKCAVFLSEQEAGENSLHACLSCSPSVVAVAVGCEGGISAEEQSMLQEHGFVSVHLKTNILRVETAALYGIAAVQSIIMEKEKWLLSE